MVQVIIVGAGCAGLAAASRLMANGISDVLIVEASDRIGGRVHTTDFGDGFVELGAQFVHGQEGNVVFDMGKAADALDLDDDESDSDFVTADGTFLDEEVVERFESVVEALEASSPAEMAASDLSLGEFLVIRYVAMNDAEQSDEVHQLSLLDWYDRLQSCDNASGSWFDISAKGYSEFRDCPGNPYIAWNHGYRTVLSLIMEESGNVEELRNRILLNRRVTRIDYSNAVAEDSSADKEGCVQATTCSTVDGNEEVLTANFVIVTVSLGVLKHTHQSLFHPPLSALKTSVIKGLDMGLVNKIFVEFPNQWWPDEWDGFNYLWPPGQTADCHTNTGNKGDCIIQALKIYGKERAADWRRSLLSFEVVHNQPPVLVGWLSGNAALCVEHLSNEQLADECHQLISSFVGRRYTVPAIKQIMKSTWYTDQNFRGSYSCRSQEYHKANVQVSHLAEPISSKQGVPAVLFAGEATHPHFYATVHGAVETGWREAERVVASVKGCEC